VCRFLILVVLVAAVIPASAIPTRPGPYVPDPIPEPGGYGSPNTPGGLCTYCAMVKCGCAPAPPGEILSAVCNCSGSNCWNSCAYIPIGE
jgi:hypothetical protein